MRIIDGVQHALQQVEIATTGHRMQEVPGQHLAAVVDTLCHEETPRALDDGWQIEEDAVQAWIGLTSPP